MGWKLIDDEEKEQWELDTVDTVSVSKPVGFDDSAYQASKPTYQNNYADRIDDLLSSLENRQEFSYDAERDPLYQQYRSQYQREGSRAVDDTLAAAATHAGGMNSYAVTAAQQANDYYNAQLMDVLPELTELAYQMHQSDYDEDVSNLKLLQAREAEAYDRYQDELGDWYADLEAAYKQYRDSVADSKWREQMDYQKEQDDRAYEKWLEQLEYERQQDAVANAQKNPQYPEQTDKPAAPEASGDRWSGTDYYQDAIDAALRGDRAAAEAALAKRGEKMASPDYHGTGGGTSMEEAYAYVESLLAGTEKGEENTAESDAVSYLRANHYTEDEISGMLTEDVWNHQRDNYVRTGTGAPEVSAYPTYEDYVKAYIQYLSEQ